MAFLNTKGRWVVVAAGLVVAAAVGYLAYNLLANKTEVTRSFTDQAAPPRKMKRMVNLPPKEDLVAPPPPPSFAPDAPVLQQVREALAGGIGPAEAVEMAAALPESPERADAAFLLLEYAAEAGNTEAAYQVARYYDPTAAIDSGTIRKNPATAFQWYRTASAERRSQAEAKMAELRRWAREKAEKGSREAKQLLDRWENPS